jgi:hypothetical protein
MSCCLSCPRCQSRKVKTVSFSGAIVPHQWQCQNCGDSCRHLCQSKAPSPRLDTVVGLTVLATLMCLTLFYLM